MANNNLGLSVTAGLDKPKSVAQINNDIKKIEGQLKKLALQVKIDGKANAEIQKQISSLNKQKRNLYIDLKLRKNDLKRQYKQAVEELQRTPVNVTVNTANAQRQMTGLTNSVRNTKNETLTLASVLRKALNNTGYVVSSQLALQLVRKAAQEATEALKEYDKYATNLSIITNGTREESNGIIADLSEKSFEFKVDISELENAYETLLRTGKAAGELDDYLKSTVFLSKVGFEDMDTSAENLVTIANAFKLQSNEIENVVSSLVALDTASNTVAGKLSTALAKTAQNGNLAGLSLDELGAIISGLRDTTGKSENEIATAINSITSRIYNVKLGKYEMELEDGSTEDITESLSDTERALKTVDISLRSTKGEFKDITQIINELVPKWNEFNNVQQNTIAKTFGGTYHKNTFIALIKNWDRIKELTEISAESAGQASAKYNSYLDSIEAKSAALSTAMKDMWNNLVPNTFVGDVAEATTGLVQFVDKYQVLQTALKSVAFYALAKGIIATKNSLLGMVTDIKNVSFAMNLATQSTAMSSEQFNSFKMVLSGLSDKQLKLVLSNSKLTESEMVKALAVNGVTEAEARQKLVTLGIIQTNQAATAATFSLSGAFKTLWASILANPIGALTIAFTGLVTIYQTVQRKQEELKESIKETADNAKEQTDNIKDLIKSYEEFADKTSYTAEEKEHLKSIQEQLVELYHGEAEGIDLVNGKYDEQIEKLKELSAEKLKDNERALVIARNQAKQEAGGSSLSNNGFNRQISFKKDWFANGDTNDYDAIVSALKENGVATTELSKNKSRVNYLYGDAEYRAEQVRKTMEVLEKYGYTNIAMYTELNTLLQDLQEKIDAENSATFNLADNTYQQFLLTDTGSLNNVKENGKEAYLAWRDGLLKSANGDNELQIALMDLAEKQFPDYTEYFSNLEKAKAMFVKANSPSEAKFAQEKNRFLIGLSDEDLEIAIQIPKLFENGLEGATAKIEAWKKSNPITPEVDTSSFEDIQKAYDELSKTATAFVKNQKTVTDAFDEQKKHGQLSADTIQALTEAGYAQALVVDKETGAVTLNKEKYDSLNKTKRQTIILEATQMKSELAEKHKDEQLAISSLITEMQTANNERREAIALELAQHNQTLSNITDSENMLEGLITSLNAPILEDSNKSTKDEEPAQVTAFKKALAEKQHLVAMKKLSEEDYLNWLDGAYKEAYAGLTGYEDDLYKYEEEIFSKRKELAEKAFDDTIEGIEKEIEALEKLKDEASIDAGEIIDPKATEELKKFNEEMQKTFGLGNVDLTKRPKVDAETMRKAGYDTEDGEIATVYSSTEFIWQGDDKNGKYVAVHYTPILPDGTVLDDESLRKYLYETLESSQDILDTDKNNLGIVLKVDTDFNISDKDIQSLETDKPTQNIQDIIKACDDWDVALHEVQEQWMELDDKVANSNVNNGDNIYEIIDKQIGLYNNAIAEIDKRIAELEASGLVGIEDEIKELNKQKDDLLDKVYNLSKERTSIGVDNEIKYWEEMQSKQNEFYDKQIEKLKKQKKLLEDKNDEEERAKDLAEKQLELRKAQIALEDARRNRNVLVYTAGGGYSYETDQTAIAEAEEDVKKAKEDLEELRQEEIKDNLDKQIEILEEQKDKDSEYYDTIIKLLEDMSGKNKVQSESNRSIWGELLATEAGQKALSQIDPDKLQELLDSGFLVQKDGKYSLGEKKPNDEKVNEVFKAGTDVISMLSKLLHKSESEIKSNDKLMNAVTNGGFNSLTMPSQSTLSELTKTKGTMVTNYNNSKISNTYHVDKIEVGYSGDDFNDMLGQAFNAMNQQITINGNKVAYGN